MTTTDHAIVKCCDRNKNFIIYWYDDCSFSIPLDVALIEKPYQETIEYCPWCGILLDTNLLNG